MYYIYVIATNASCAIVIEDQADQADQASSANDFTCNGVPKIEKRVPQLTIINDKDVANLVGKTSTQSEKYEALKSITVPAKDYKFPVREFKTRTGVCRRSFIHSWIGK
ncbi:hypothetical protein EMCRGX_G033648 [Ephydatia muelleri]